MHVDFFAANSFVVAELETMKPVRRLPRRRANSNGKLYSMHLVKVGRNHAVLSFGVLLVLTGSLITNLLELFPSNSENSLEKLQNT